MKTTQKIKLTEMQQFALDFLRNEKKEINPNYLASVWAEHKTGRSGVASRDRFGYTSAAYKTLRKLADMGLINRRIQYGRSYTFEYFSITTLK